MSKNLYIDASHPNETRVVLKSNDSIEDYEYEGLKNNLIKNNIRDNDIPALLIYKGDEKIQSFESKQWKELLQ